MPALNVKYRSRHCKLCPWHGSRGRTAQMLQRVTLYRKGICFKAVLHWHGWWTVPPCCHELLTPVNVYLFINVIIALHKLFLHVPHHFFSSCLSRPHSCPLLDSFGHIHLDSRKDAYVSSRRSCTQPHHAYMERSKGHECRFQAGAPSEH